MATTEITTPSAAPSTAAKTPARKSASSATPSAAPLAAKKRVVAAKRPTSAVVKQAAAVATAKTSRPKVQPVTATSSAEASLPVASETKTHKEKKPKMVRDSVTIPKAEYQALDVMKQRAADLKTMVKKTELIRAGIKLLSTLPDAAFLAAIAGVPSLKTGRPSKD